MSDQIWRSLAAAGSALVLGAVTATPAGADSVRDRQWHLGALDIVAAHKVSKGAGVVIGLVDTGVQADHRDLAGAVLAGSDTYPNATGDGRNDSDGHGTELAGLIAGRGHGGNSGILGIAPAAKILPVRAPVGTLSSAEFLAAGIDEAVARKVGVINMSFGSNDEEVLHEAIRKAKAADIVLVGGVGNKSGSVSDEEGTDSPFPGKYPEVLTVGATDRQGRIADFSVTGPQVDVVAPGVDLATTGIGETGYSLVSGTSDSTAIVSGVAALVRAEHPDLSAAEVVHRITATAIDA
ncbi:S8 family serine peptidase, partial [Actinoplanes sp. NPDC051633]|uniref:S8 family serine peptidase n=1 Tax=Actinoplanes sp. NPDC051633 TaxID=3155670 RepID=UPI00342F21BE